MEESSECELIAHAWFENGQLVVLSRSSSCMVVPFDLHHLVKFIGGNIEDATQFEIDEDGRFLYWPHADVHFGWEQFSTMKWVARTLATD